MCQSNNDNIKKSCLDWVGQIHAHAYKRIAKRKSRKMEKINHVELCQIKWVEYICISFRLSILSLKNVVYWKNRMHKHIFIPKCSQSV